MKNLNQDMGHEAHNEDDVKRINKSKTLRAVKQLCVKYLCEANEATLTRVKDKDIYSSYKAMKKLAMKVYKAHPTNDDVIVNTITRYKKYFRSTEGRKREWKIMKVFPELSEKQDALYQDFWFCKQNEVVQIDILKVASFCKDKFEMVAITAFLQMNIDDVEFLSKDQDAELRKYAKLTGFDPVVLTRS